MTFLSPQTALWAAALAVPALLLLYFLKLRRRYLRIASTMLWRRSYEDLEVNAPFQRLRFSLLLLLQFAVLMALIAAMARPSAGGEAPTAPRIVLLIDRSASMNALDAALDGDVSRLDAARNEAGDMVRRLGRGLGAQEFMVIAFARSPQIVSGFDFDRQRIMAAIDSITPTDEAADLSAALQLAAGFAGDSEEEDAHSADVVLFSDGVVGRPDDALGFRLRAGNFRFVQIGPPHISGLSSDSTSQIAHTRSQAPNLGIVSFSARRDFEDPTRMLVFARLLNTAPEPVNAVLTLRLDDEPVNVRRVTVPQAAEGGAPASPGELTVTFALEMPGGGVLQLHHNRRDALAGDDAAALVMPPPMRPRIALVHGESVDPFLLDLLEMLEPRELRTLAQPAFEQLDRRELDGGVLFDLIVFDRVSAERLPGVPTLTFGGVPRGIDAVGPRAPAGQRILSWDRQHPLMRHVGLDTIVYSNFGGYQLPPGATALAHGSDGPIIASLRVRNARHVLVGFELRRSNWPMHVSIAVFIQNALDYLTAGEGGSAGQMAQAHRPGETIALRARPDASELRIRGPLDATIPVEPGGMATLPPLRRVGIYEVDGGVVQRVAVSMLSDQESDIRPSARLLVNAEQAHAAGRRGLAPRELWPWLIAAALVLLVVEWLVYLRRVAG